MAVFDSSSTAGAFIAFKSFTNFTNFEICLGYLFVPLTMRFVPEFSEQTSLAASESVVVLSSFFFETLEI